MIKADQIIRSRRRSVGLTITSDAKLIVHAPMSITQSRLDELLQQKSKWIKRKQAFFLSRPKPTQRQFTEGEQFQFLGQIFLLRLVDNQDTAVQLRDELCVHRMSAQHIKDHILNWYKEQAFMFIQSRALYFADQQGLKFKNIKINSAKTRWGSCSYTDNLNFTWRLIMAPPRVVDYVVVHELMHLKQRNHSSKFWLEVQKVIPDYRNDEIWLKKHGHLCQL